MRIKVCGISRQSNLDFLNSSNVDFIGFIFYHQSQRNFGDGDIKGGIHTIKNKVGVFVNEEVSRIDEMAQYHSLDYLQLHGDETVQECKMLKAKGYSVIKAFPVKDQLPSVLNDYEGVVDFFLFDTKGTKYGGNGTQFNWSILDDYNLNTQFILSGGIGLEDVDQIKSLSLSKLYAVDVNSRFEVMPGLKNEQELKEFIEELKK